MNILIKLGNFFFHNRNWLFPFFYILLFIPTIKISDNYNNLLIIGIIITIIGSLIRFLTIGFVYIAKSGVKNRINASQLLAEGLLKHSRNPLYVGNVTIMLGMTILSNSLLAVFILFPFFVFIYYTIIFSEEKYLTEKFGKEYLEYKSKVNRWLFNFKGFGETLKTTKFSWKRALRVEYGVIFLWMIPATVLIFLQLHRLNGIEFYLKYRILLFAIILFEIILYSLIRFLKKTKRLRD